MYVNHLAQSVVHLKKKHTQKNSLTTSVNATWFWNWK